MESLCYSANKESEDAHDVSTSFTASEEAPTRLCRTGDTQRSTFQITCTTTAHKPRWEGAVSFASKVKGWLEEGQALPERDVLGDVFEEFQWSDVMRDDFLRVVASGE